MRLVRRLLGIALVTGGVVYLYGRRRALRATRGADLHVGNSVGTSTTIAEDLGAVAAHSGNADVDPEPISQVAGEAIDLVGDVAAREELVDPRARLPRH